MDEDKNIQQYEPTEKDKKSRKWVYDAFDVMWDVQNNSYTQFNGKRLIDFLDDCRKSLNLMAHPREDGRSNVKSVSPLNKIMAILARVALSRPKLKIVATTKMNVIDKKRADVINDLYTWSTEYAGDLEHSGNSEYFFKGFDCAGDGTLITYEGFDSQTHTRNKITKFDPDTGEVEYDKEKFQTNKCFSQNIRPEDFYIWNPYVRNVQRQPKVAWRTVYDKAHFEYEFKNYKNAKYATNRELQMEYHDRESYYKQEWFSRIDKKQVEVIRIYDRYEDKMVIIANGVVLQDSPMPWKNGSPKKYPFAKTVYQPFAGGEFFWGMAFPFKLKGDKEALETLYNLGIEQMKLSVNPPQLTTTENEIEDNMLLPGRVIEVDNPENFRELQFKSPDQSYFGFIQQIRENIDLSSVDPASQGVNVQDVTARGQVIAEENARKLLGIFNLMMESLVLQEARLRIPNLLQFMVIPGNTFRVENTMIGSAHGVREIKVVGNKEESESPRELDMIENMAKLQGVNLERLNIMPGYLNNIDYSIAVLPESAYQQGKSMMIALESEKLSLISNLFPNVFQAASELFFKDVMQAYDTDPQPYLDAVQQTMQENAEQIEAQGGGQTEGVEGRIGTSAPVGTEKGKPGKLVGELTGSDTGKQPSLSKITGKGGQV
jgi:hypothetical protein